jgi:hypothetical protein
LNVFREGRAGRVFRVIYESLPRERIPKLAHLRAEKKRASPARTAALPTEIAEIAEID